MLTGADAWEAIEQFGQSKLDWLHRFAPFSAGIPSHDRIASGQTRPDPRQPRVHRPKRLSLKTQRAFRIKDAHRRIYRRAADRASAAALLKRWYQWACRCRLEPIERVAKTLKDHLDGVLNAFDPRFTNGRVEAINALIQAAKAKARGCGTIQRFITDAYLVASKLTHLPLSPFKLQAGATASA